MPALRTPRLLLVTALVLACAPPALAQRAVTGDLQAQMTPQEFRAAGLDKLSPAELAALNAWLQGKVADASAQAAEQARRESAQALAQAKEQGRQEVIAKNRGFFDFGSSEPIESTLSGRFDGFGKGKHYVLANGQEWEQTEAASLDGVHLVDPKVSIRPGLMGVWYMRVDKYNTQAKVRRIK